MDKKQEVRNLIAKFNRNDNNAQVVTSITTTSPITKKILLQSGPSSPSSTSSSSSTNTSSTAIPVSKTPVAATTPILGTSNKPPVATSSPKPPTGIFSSPITNSKAVSSSTKATNTITATTGSAGSKLPPIPSSSSSSSSAATKTATGAAQLKPSPVVSSTKAINNTGNGKSNPLSSLSNQTTSTSTTTAGISATLTNKVAVATSKPATSSSSFQVGIPSDNKNANPSSQNNIAVSSSSDAMKPKLESASKPPSSKTLLSDASTSTVSTKRPSLTKQVVEPSPSLSFGIPNNSQVNNSRTSAVGEKMFLLNSLATNGENVAVSMKSLEQEASRAKSFSVHELTPPTIEIDNLTSPYMAYRPSIAEESTTSDDNAEDNDNNNNNSSSNDVDNENGGRRLSLKKRTSGLVNFMHDAPPYIPTPASSATGSSISSISTKKSSTHIRGSSTKFSFVKKRDTQSSMIRGMTIITIEGVSMRWFLKFIYSDEFIKQKLSEGNNYKISDFVDRIKELTKDKMESISEKLLRQHGSKFVRERADIYISHTWASPLKDFVNAIEFMLQDAPPEEDMYMWFDALVINQHFSETKDCDPELWVPTIMKTVNDIGRLAIVLSPHYNPYNLIQSWCLWELYSATTNKDTQIDLIILPDQIESFRTSVREDLLGVLTKLCNINITTSTTTTEAEQKSILFAVTHEIGGIDAVHENIISVIRDWLADVAIEVIEEMEIKISNGEEVDMDELGFMCNSVAELLNIQGKLSEQEVYLRRALEIFIHLNGSDDPDVAVGLNNLALLLQDQQRYDEAETLFKQAIGIDRSALGNIHPDVAGGLNNLAFLYQERKRFKEAEPLFQESIEIFEKYLGSGHPDVATALNNLALLLMDMGENEKAVECFAKSYQIYKNELGDEHPYARVAIQYLHEAEQAGKS